MHSLRVDEPARRSDEMAIGGTGDGVSDVIHLDRAAVGSGIVVNGTGAVIHVAADGHKRPKFNRQTYPGR